ncbi:glycosyltransferase family 2 protein [Actinoplanes sp. NBRC 103695]|uniref:glycosyltransferase family 2 protein n=1 Tax=Actinoplanes sp. NBRC 103695 TaxID=3032202 RepID=UPI0024A5BBFF|nr:glycosyltransferase family 2 protein [Actinoplanes sp. NBRC 103695]GLY95879.1 hypothetical protein Acsp02_31340 [Actinoplanes sp. NBRC 103695]
MPPSPPAPGAQRDGPTVSVVLPALDEAANISHVLQGLPALVDEVIVVDGGSSDDTVAVARQTRAGTHVVRQTRSGKGNALACGIAASRGDIVVLMSADGSCDPSDIPRFVQALSGGADAAHGSRFRGRGGDLEAGRLEIAGDHHLRRQVNKAFGTRYTDVGSGYHAFWRATLDDFDLPAPEQPGLRRGQTVWGDGPEINPMIAVRMAALGLRVVEIAVVRYPRIHGARRRRAFARIMRGRRVLRAEQRRVSRTGSKTEQGYARSTRTAAERTTGRHALPEAPPQRSLPEAPPQRSLPDAPHRPSLPDAPHGTSLPEARPRRPYPGPRPDWADSVGQHRTEDLIANSAHRRSGVYESGVHRVQDGALRSSAVYDTGVHRTGVYDTGVHRTEIYDTGALPVDGVPREVGGGRRRLDADDRRSHEPPRAIEQRPHQLPRLDQQPQDQRQPDPPRAHDQRRPDPHAYDRRGHHQPPGLPRAGSDDNMPFAGRPASPRAIPGERRTR